MDLVILKMNRVECAVQMEMKVEIDEGGYEDDNNNGNDNNYEPETMISTTMSSTTMSMSMSSKPNIKSNLLSLSLVQSKPTNTIHQTQRPINSLN